MSSSIVKQDYKLFIYLPESYTVNSDRTFPVVYQLDANNFFGSVTEIAQLLSFGPRFPGEANIPDFIIVGIGYDTKELRELMPLRNRDLTPVFQESHPNSGGSENFLSFIARARKEKADEVEAKMWGEGGKTFIPMIKEAFNIPVEDAVGAANLVARATA